MRAIYLLLLAMIAAGFVGCQSNATPSLPPGQCIPVVTVEPQDVVSTRKALSSAGIPSYVDSSKKPNRILVPPEYYQQAMNLLRQLSQMHSLYGTTPE